MKSVLFVDDEPAALEGLRIRLWGLRDKWRMEFADSGLNALAAMEQRQFDVIVSDGRMPGMDGAHLLEIVRDRWPQTVRIILSACTQLEQTVRLVPVAHQYLGKPCEPHQLESSIERCFALRRVLEQPALRAVVGKLRQLPPIPRTYAQLQSVMANERVSAHEVAEIISRDTVIAAKVLHMVNSAFFRAPRRITSIEHAVVYLGLSTVRNLVVSAEVFAAWPKDRPVVDLAHMQSHALHVASAVHALTANTAIAEDALLAALLHDIGYWVLSQEHPASLCDALLLSANESIALDEAETRVFGASHAEVGAYLLGLWGFSSTIVEAVAHHHAPTRVPQSGFDVLAALSIAHALADSADAQAFKAVGIPRSDVDASYLATVQAPFSWPEAARRVEENRMTGACGP